MGMVTDNGPFVITRGEGVRIYDDAGNEYLDATAGLWFTNVGHGRTEIGEAVGRQLSTVAHYSNFGDYAGEGLIALAERVAAMAPVPGSKVMFTSGGSDAVDTAVKLYERLTHQP